MGTSEPPLKKTKELADLFNVDINILTNKNLEFLISHDRTQKSGGCRQRHGPSSSWYSYRSY